MDSWMGRYNSNARNRGFNNANHNGTNNLPPANMPGNGSLPSIDLNLPYVPNGTEEDLYSSNGMSNYSAGGISLTRTTTLIPSETLPRTSLQRQNLLWASSSTNTHFSGTSMINLVGNTTHTTFIGGPSTSRNQLPNAIIQSSVTHMMNMSDLSQPALRFQSNFVIRPSSGPPPGYLRANEIGANFWRNNMNPPQPPLVIGGSTINTAAGGSMIIREPGHRDDPIIIQDDDEDDNGDAQQGMFFYNGDMSYEALLALQESIGEVGSGLKRKVISEHLKKSKYQSTKMNDCPDNCCICLGTHGDGDELGEINCGHVFHYHCIRKWLKVKNSCPICKRTALTP